MQVVEFQIKIGFGNGIEYSPTKDHMNIDFIVTAILIPLNTNTLELFLAHSHRPLNCPLFPRDVLTNLAAIQADITCSDNSNKHWRTPPSSSALS